VINLPRRSVTRFFIPLIDVLILLFCIFLLMPFVSTPTAPEPAPDSKVKPPDKPLPTKIEDLQMELTEARLLVARLQREHQARLTDRLAVRVLEIDPRDGTLFYYDPGRVDVRSYEDVLALVQKQKSVASSGGVVKDVFFLVLYPRRVPGQPPSPFPLAEQEARTVEWFKKANAPLGFDRPGAGP
jgi:hypothetical protein